MPRQRDASCVLLVEDDTALRDGIAATLRRQSFEVDLAGDGGVAIEMLRAKRYSVVVLDLMLPTVSGYEVIDFVKKQRRLVPASVIVTTATDPETIRNIDRSVVKEIFFKPLDMEALAQHVGRFCSLSR